jgi:hypothetical protein
MLLVTAHGSETVAKLDFRYIKAPRVTMIQPSKAFWYFSLEVLIICEIVEGVNAKGISSLAVCTCRIWGPRTRTGYRWRLVSIQANQRERARQTVHNR